MASALSNAHIEAERRLRLLIADQVERIWRALPGYDRPDLDRWLSTVLPVVLAGQRASVALTDGYLARSLERPPIGLTAEEIIARSRPGVSAEEQWRRPFVTTWTALGNGVAYEAAVASGLARAGEMAAFDIQDAMRQSANAVQQADDSIIGYERVADADACTFCQEVDTAFIRSADAMALHNNCGCGLEPVTASARGQRIGQKGQHGKRVAVHQHGEMGAVLGSPDHNFTTEAVALG